MLKLRTKFRCIVAAYMFVPIGGMIAFSYDTAMFRTEEFQQILGVSVAVTLLLAFSSPVLLGLRWSILSQLKQIATAISRIKTGNYTYFTLPNEPSETGDENELVALMRDMNWMIRQIEYRETELEERVAQRTRQLEEINAELIRARDDAQASARAKSEFLATMSHEIRTPMNAIIGMSDLAVKSCRDSRQEEVLTVINTASKSLLKIINDILDFSKMDAGKLVLESIPVRIRDLMDEAADLFRTQVREAPVEFILKVDPGVPEMVMGDPLRLRQVLVNLISNAFKFTEEGEILLEVRPEPGHGIRFSVADTGVGMDESTCRVLFTPFTQADGSTTRKFGGTGLGLAISRKLVCLMGSDIYVESTPGRGSCFSFSLDLESCTGESSAEMRVPHSLAGRKALVAAEHQITGKILMGFLKDLGMVPLGNLEKGDEILGDGAEPTDVGLVVVDADLTWTDPNRLAERLTARFQVPAIAVGSARSLAGDAAPGWAARVLLKPVKQSLLYGSIADICRGKTPVPSDAPAHDASGDYQAEASGEPPGAGDPALAEKLSGMMAELGRLLDQNSLKAKAFSREVSGLLAGTPWQREADLLMIQAGRFDFAAARTTFDQLRDNVRSLCQ